MWRRLNQFLFLCGAAIFLYCALQLREAVRLVNDEDALAARILPRPGPLTSRDRTLAELLGVLEEIPEAHRESLWDLDRSRTAAHPPRPQPPPRDPLEETSRARAELVERVLALPADLDPPGTGPVLQGKHRFLLVRRLLLVLADEVLNLLGQGSTDPALDLLEHRARLGRLLSRGIENHSTMLARLMGAAGMIQGSRLGQAVERHSLLAPGGRRRLATILEEELSRDIPLDLSVEAELTVSGRAVALLDQQLGLLQHPLRLYWGDGPRQVEALRQRWREGWTPLDDEEISRLHLMIQLSLPNLARAKEKIEAIAAERAEVVASLRGE